MSEFDHFTGRPALIDAALEAHARDNPDRVWCEIDGRSHTYGEIDRAVNRLARQLRGEFGVRRGDRVAVRMGNRAEYFHAMFAILRLGAVYVPCSTRATAPELAWQLDHCGASVLVTDDEGRASAPAGERAVLSVDETPDDSRPGGDALDVERVDAGDLAMVMYTSGTTSRPRGVMFTHGNLRAAADTAERAFRWVPGDRYLHYFPLYHSNGGLHGVMPAVLAGATLVMVPRFSASAFGRQLRDLDITFCAVNATHVRMILTQPVDPADADHRAWRMMLGLSIEQAERDEFESRFATRLCPTYGLTEGVSITAIGEPVGPRGPDSASRVVAGYRLRLVDDEGAEVPIGEAGEAEIRADHAHGLSPGYFGDRQATEAAFREGWLRTGDVLRADPDGWLTFVERRKDMIKRAGFNVAPAEVERVLCAVTGVEDAAVVGIPDPVREEAIVAFVAGGPQLAAADLLAACAAELAEYKVPQRIEFLAALPRDVLGKVDKKSLRARAMSPDERAAR
jgi:crotonobetaine/carnitine-CoA ligase